MTTITQEPREIAFEDIRKGDLIRLEYPIDFGVKATRRGVAHERRGSAWHTREGGYIAGPATSANITLLHRPAPAEPKGLGAIVRTDEGIEFISVNRTPGTPRWVIAMIDDVRGERRALRWAEFDLDNIEVLSDGDGEES